MEVPVHGDGGRRRVQDQLPHEAPAEQPMWRPAAGGCRAVQQQQAHRHVLALLLLRCRPAKVDAGVQVVLHVLPWLLLDLE